MSNTKIYAPEGFPITSLTKVHEAFDALEAQTQDPRATALKSHHSGMCTMCNEGIRLDAEWETVVRRE